MPYPAKWSISLVVYLWKSWNWLSTGDGFLSSLPADMSLRPWWRYFDHQVYGHYGIISQTSHKNTDFSLFWQGYSVKNAFLKGRRKKIICSITFFKSVCKSLPSWRSPETRILICLQIIITCLLTVRVCSKLNQAENRLFLQLKSERILYILLAFLIQQ